MTKYCFAPGPVPVEETIKITYSHRSKDFIQLYLATVAMLEDWTKRKVVLIQGSASAAIESVLDSMHLENGRVLVLNNGSFAQRVVDKLNRVGNLVVEAPTCEKAIDVLLAEERPFYQAVYAVQFETSNSTYNYLDALGALCNVQKVPFIVDAVSAFPYYSFPDLADVVILSSSKQLRGLPVLGIVSYKEEIESKFENAGGYLNLKKAIEYGKKGQTPHTSLIPQIYSLWISLVQDAWKPLVESIEGNVSVLTEQLEDNIIGEKIAPVITFQTKNVEEVIKKLSEVGLDVYYNSAYSGHRIQVSCFNYGWSVPYEELNEALIELKEGGLL